MTNRLTTKALQQDIGVKADGIFGPVSRAALLTKFTNVSPVALTDADIAVVAKRWGVPVGHIKGVRKVEAPRGAFDTDDRPSILYERHVFSRNTEPKGRFNAINPQLSATNGYGPGGYGKFSEQYDRLARACALDPHAAFEACSWGAFQILGEGAVDICGYASPYDMAKSLIAGEKAHLDSFVRFVEGKGLVDKFRACRPNDPTSCIPFVTGYNGTGYAQFDYHNKLAVAIAA